MESFFFNRIISKSIIVFLVSRSKIVPWPILLSITIDALSSSRELKEFDGSISSLKRKLEKEDFFLNRAAPKIRNILERTKSNYLGTTRGVLVDRAARKYLGRIFPGVEWSNRMPDILPTLNWVKSEKWQLYSRFSFFRFYFLFFSRSRQGEEEQFR